MIKRKDIRILASYVNAPDHFPEGNVPVAYVAKKMQKDACFIRTGIEAGWLPIGFCHRKQGKKNASYYISPKLLWEVTGILYDPQET